MIDNRRFFNLSAWGYDFITRQEIWRDQIRKTLSHAGDLISLDRILDLGCGPGISSFVLGEALSDVEIIGVDVSDAMIRRARRHRERSYGHLENVSFRRADVYDLHLDQGSFDLVVGHSFLYLLPDRGEALCAIHRVLRPGGRLVLMEPNAEGNLLSAVGRSGDLHWLRSPWTATRFATSMVLWRIVSRSQGQLRADKLGRLFGEAGFNDCDVNLTLGGLGLHATGRK